MGRARSAPPRSGRRGALVLTVAFCIFLAPALASANPVVSQFAPDLLLANPAIHPMPPYEGDVVRVSVTVTNVGDLAALAATVSLIDGHPDGDPVPIGTVGLSAPLGSGQSTVVEMPLFFAFGVGDHTLTIRVGDVSPAEANTSNDALSIGMHVLPAKSPPPPRPSDGLRAEALEALGLGAFLGFGLVILIIAVAISFVARRRPTELEPPPPEPRDESPPPIWPP